MPAPSSLVNAVAGKLYVGLRVAVSSVVYAPLAFGSIRGAFDIAVPIVTLIRMYRPGGILHVDLSLWGNAQVACSAEVDYALQVRIIDGIDPVRARLNMDTPLRRNPSIFNPFVEEDADAI